MPFITLLDHFQYLFLFNLKNLTYINIIKSFTTINLIFSSLDRHNPRLFQFKSQIINTIQPKHAITIVGSFPIIHRLSSLKFLSLFNWNLLNWLLSLTSDTFKACALDIWSCCFVHVWFTFHEIYECVFLLLYLLLCFLLFLYEPVSFPNRFTHRFNPTFLQHLLILEQLRLKSLIRINNRSSTPNITDSLCYGESFLSHQVHKHKSCRLWNIIYIVL